MVSVLSILLGAIFAASFSLELEALSWLMPLMNVAALAGLLFFIQRRRAIVKITSLFCISWFSFGLCWLYISMHRYGNMPSLMAAAAVVLFAIYLSSFYVAAAALVSKASRGQSINLWLLAGAFVLADMARGYLFSGFPWLAFGYGQVDSALANLAPFIGMYGVGLFTLLIAVCLSNLFDASVTKKHQLAMGMVIITSIGMASIFKPTSTSESDLTPITISLVQGNVPQDMKFDRGRIADTMENYTRAIEAATSEVIVLPETAWTMLWSATPERIKDRIATKAKSSTVIIGQPYADNATIANSVATISSTGNLAYRYDKHHLVPFGEFIPLGFEWFVRMMSIPLGNFDRGSLDQPPLAIGKNKLAFNICYEDLFGEEIIEAVRNGATILVNVSNLAWFGDSHALFQHLQIARMRAIETARPIIRSTNTGVTTHIDAGGKVLARLANFERKTLSVNVSGGQQKTLYVRVGNWLTLALCAAILVWARSRKATVKMAA
jgi:apolipoprotein N-acyltransferase